MKFLGPVAQFVGLKVTGGSPGTGKVLLSDVDGGATWGAVPVSENVEVFDPSGPAVTLAAASVATVHRVVLGQNCTVTLPTPVLGHVHWVRVAQDATGGRTLTWAGTVNWPGGVVPTQATAAGAYSVYAFACDDPTFGWVARQAGSGGDLAAHLADTTAAHAASAISFTPVAFNVATDVQEAITSNSDFLEILSNQKANLASPAFTGNPTAPTQTARTNSTRLATTAYADRGPSVNPQTGTTYTLGLADADRAVHCANAAAITVTVPTNASVAFPVGTVLTIRQTGAGQVTVAPAGGVTLRAYGGAKTAGQWAATGLHKIGTDEWALDGGVA